MTPARLNVAITALLQLTAAAGKVSSLIATAKAEDRDLTDAELDQLQQDDAAARAGLVDAIEAARAEGR